MTKGLRIMIYWIIFIILFFIGAGLVCYAVSAAATQGEELNQLLLRKETEGSNKE